MWVGTFCRNGRRNIKQGLSSCELNNAITQRLSVYINRKIRYPKGKEYITGYSYEPWHIRYVGVEVATEIMQNNLTLEEYLDLA